MYIGKIDTILRQGKCMHKKMYASRIKATRGLQCLDQKDSKPLSHRIVRRKMKREMDKEIKES